MFCAVKVFVVPGSCFLSVFVSTPAPDQTGTRYIDLSCLALFSLCVSSLSFSLSLSLYLSLSLSPRVSLFFSLSFSLVFLSRPYLVLCVSGSPSLVRCLPILVSSSLFYLSSRACFCFTHRTHAGASCMHAHTTQPLCRGVVFIRPFITRRLGERTDGPSQCL